MPSTVLPLAQTLSASLDSPIDSPGGAPHPASALTPMAIAPYPSFRNSILMMSSQLDGHVDCRRTAGLFGVAAEIAACARRREIDHDLDVAVEWVVTTLP